MTLSMAASKWGFSMLAANSLAAIRADSLQMLARSAPVKPGVRAASVLESSSLSSSVLSPERWTFRMEARP